MTSMAKDIQTAFTAAAIVLDLLGEFCSDKFKQGEGISYLEKVIVARRAALRFLAPSNPLRPWPSNNLAVHLSARHSLLGTRDDLEEAIAIHHIILTFGQPGHPVRPMSVNNLACCLYTRYTRLGMTSDLEEAIVMHRDALELRPPGNPSHSVSLSNLACCLYARYEKLGMTSDLEEATTLHRRALEFRLVGHPDRSTSLNNLASCLFSWYDKAGGMNNLEQAITIHRSALELHPAGHPDRPMSLYNLARCLYARYKELGAVDDLEEAITMHRAALELRPQGHPDRAAPLNGLAICVNARFQDLGTMNDLEEAIVLHRSALDLCSPGDHLRSSSMTNLGVCLSTRYSELGAMSDLEEAIGMHRSALELHPPGNPYRSTPLHNLALCLSFRYDQLGMMDDLEEAIVKFRGSVELLQPGNPHRFSCLNNLANCLFTRHEQLGAMNDLEESTSIQRDVSETYSLGHPCRSSSMDTLGRCLAARYNLLGDASALEEAIRLHRDAVKLCPPGQRNRSASLNNLAFALMTRYNYRGGLADLEESVATYQNALELHPLGHPRRPMLLDNLAYCLCKRYGQLSIMGDLEDALAMHRDALALRPPGNPDRSYSLEGISVCLAYRHRRLGVMNDLEEAIATRRSALQLRPEGHAYRFTSLHNLALSLTTRFQRLGEVSDLEDAVVLYQDALRLQLPNQADRAQILHGFAECLSLRYHRLGDMTDLAEAIATHRAALQRLPVGHPLRAATIRSLTACSLASNQSCTEDVFDLYSQLSDVSHTVSFGDLETAKAWVYAAETSSHHSTVLAYQTSLRFLIHHLYTLPPMPQNLVVLKEFTSSLAVDAFSACVRHKKLANAVELVEQGRSVFWTQYLRFRSPLEDVIESAGDTGKTLAESLTQLSSLLRNILDFPPLNPPSASSQLDQAWHLTLRLQIVVDEIRKLPGHSHFLLPLLFSDLRRAAIGGPIIIVNASQYSCDAVIVLSDNDPIHIPLRITQTRVRELASKLRRLISQVKFFDVKKDLIVILRELWDDVVSPIVTVLQISHPRRSRIWWCPTAEFSLLPLHAAGPYRKGQLNLANLYISSYTPTLTALIRAREKDSMDFASGAPRFHAVGQAKAPGQQVLSAVSGELAHIAERIAPFATFTVIEGKDASIANVTEALSKTEYVHLACHGLPRRKRPFESAFGLCDGRLKIEDIMRCNLQQARFAYLSACHTTVGDEESPDEVIHLAAAMHFAGFCSVVGTMWAVDDEVTEVITSTFYAHMVDESGRLDHTRAAYALNRTMRRFTQIPFDQQVLFIHIGA